MKENNTLMREKKKPAIVPSSSLINGAFFLNRRFSIIEPCFGVIEFSFFIVWEFSY
jgi:hypothetical protein